MSHGILLRAIALMAWLCFQPPAAFLQAVSRQLRQCVDDQPSKPSTLPSSLPVPSDARAYDAHQCQQEIKLRHIDVGAAAMLEERWPPSLVVSRFNAFSHCIVHLCLFHPLSRRHGRYKLTTPCMGLPWPTATALEVSRSGIVGPSMFSDCFSASSGCVPVVLC